MFKKIADYLSVNMVGYRKMSMAAAFLCVCVTLLVKGYVPGEDFVKDVGLVFIAFFGANLAEHHIKSKPLKSQRKLIWTRLRSLLIQ